MGSEGDNSWKIQIAKSDGMGMLQTGQPKGEYQTELPRAIDTIRQRAGMSNNMKSAVSATCSLCVKIVAFIEQLCRCSQPIVWLWDVFWMEVAPKLQGKQVLAVMLNLCERL